MSTIVLRSVKGTPLTNSEVDSNFTNLNNDKTELGGTYSSGTANGVLFLNGSKVLTTGSALQYAASGNYLAMTDSVFTGLVGKGNQIVNGAAASDMAIQSSLGGFAIGTGANNERRFQITATGESVWYPSTSAAAGSEQMRLTSTGLGIGTSSPAYKLDVAGTINSGASSATGYNLVFRTSGITTGRVQTGLTNTSGDLYTGVEGSTAGQTLTGSAAYSSFIGTFAANPLYLVSNATIRATLDSSGNLGLGVTPSATSGSYKNVQNGLATLMGSSSDPSAYLNANATFNSGWKYIANGTATRYEQGASHAWFTAPSGTAGNAISFTQAATLTAAGDLLVGMTSSNAYQRVSWSGANSGDTSIPWANVSSVAINIATLFPSLNVAAGQTMSFMLQIVTSSTPSSATSARILCLRNGNSSWSFGSVESIGTGATVTPSGSSNTITLTFSGGGQYGMCRVQALSN